MNGSIETALRDFSSISIDTAQILGSPSAIANARGRPSMKRCKIISHLRPRHEAHGPVIPASLKNASPLGNMRASFVGMCVWVPTTACALPSRCHAIETFSEVVSAWKSRNTASHSGLILSIISPAAANGQLAFIFMSVCPSSENTPSFIPSFSRMRYVRPGLLDGRFAGRQTFSSAPISPSKHRWSQMWSPRVMASTPQRKSSSAMFFVSPFPPAAFSALAITKSVPRLSRMRGRLSARILLPGLPTMSPTKKILIARKAPVFRRLRACRQPPPSRRAPAEFLRECPWRRRSPQAEASLSGRLRAAF